MLKYMLMVYTYLPFPGSWIVRLVVLRVYLIMHWGYQLCHSMCKGRSSKISKFLTFCSTILLIHHLLKICTTFEQWLIDVKSAVTLEQCLLVDKMNFKMLWSAFFHISNFSSAARGHFSIMEIFFIFWPFFKKTSNRFFIRQNVQEVAYFCFLHN